jgi:hypothetical protein
MSRAYRPHLDTVYLAGRVRRLPGVKRVEIIPPQRRLTYDTLVIRPQRPTRILVWYEDGREDWTLPEARRRVLDAEGRTYDGRDGSLEDDTDG